MSYIYMYKGTVVETVGGGLGNGRFLPWTVVDLSSVTLSLICGGPKCTYFLVCLSVCLPTYLPACLCACLRTRGSLFFR